MALRVLPDSEDEEEDLTSTIAVKTNTSSQLVPTVPINAQSTGSTERIRRDAEQAARALASRSAVTAASQSPNMKRRHSELPAEPLTVSARLKRIKSARDSPPISSGLLTGAFSEHSQQAHSSGESFLAQGSIKEGFLAHDPQSMFGQSGDTEPHNTATQQLVRDIAAAHTRRQVEFEDLRKFAETLHAPKSSSALPETSQLYVSPQGQTQNDLQHINTNPTQEEADSEVLGLQAPAIDDEHEGSQEPPETAHELPPSQASTTSIHVADTRSTRKKASSIKSALEDLPEALMNSQSDLIGLPKEKYVPRPSRRRATQLPDNFVSNPDKIGRTKRARTSRADLPSKTTADAPAHEQEDVSIVIGVTETTAVEIENKENAASAEPAANGDDSQPGRDELALSQPQLSADTQKQDSSASETIFVKPAPRKRGKQAKKPKRSHTTIFEDHVNLPDKEQAPSLSQQQADRKVALGVLENAQDKRSNRAKRQVIGEEDELSLDFGSSRKEELVRLAVKSSMQFGSPSKLPEIAASSSPIKRSKSGATEAPLVNDDVKDNGDIEPPQSTQDPQRALTPDATPPPKITPRRQIIMARTDAKAVPKHPIVFEKSSPPKHSPIKVMQAPMRVGLSKKHRIPSLLKMMRPAKK